MIKPNVKLECVPKFCHLGDTLGSGGGVEEAARARVRCAWAKLLLLSLLQSPIPTAWGASYHIKGKIQWRNKFTLGPGAEHKIGPPGLRSYLSSYYSCDSTQ